MTLVQIHQESVSILLCIRKGMNISLLSLAICKQTGRLDFFALVRKLILEKEKSELKAGVIRLKVNLMSLPACGRRGG